MAVLEKLRGWGIVLSILVALPLLLFIIDPSQIAQTVQSVSSKYDVGKIGGNSISYTDFQAEVDRFTHINELMTGNTSLNEQQQKQIRDAVWQRLVEQNLFVKNAKAAGINVGKNELMDLINGANISPVIASLFVDENGNFSSEQLVDFVQTKEDGDENAKAIWDYLQESILTSQFYTKYNSLFANSTVENALQVRNSIENNNTTADVDFVMVPFSFATDTTIVVSDKEINDFYDNHKKLYDQKASRDIEYVVFQVVPSAEDIAAANDDFVKRYEEFTTTDDVRAFLQRNNSDTQWDNRWYKAGDFATVNADIDTFVSENTEGTSPVVSANNTLYAGRVMATKTMPETVTIRHMMFQTNEDGQHLADSLLNELRKGGDFSALAEAYSLDRGTVTDGEFGKVGKISQSTVSSLPTGFEAIFDAKVGQPFILKSSIATHIVEVTEAGELAPFKQVALFSKEIAPSTATQKQYYNDANRVATLAAGKYANYRAACDSIGVYSHSMTISESTETYGAINAKKITRWAFDNKPGKVSNIIDVDNNYFFVVAVTGAQKEGIAPVAAVASRIKDNLYAEKYAEKQQSLVADKIAGMNDLEAIAEKLGTSVNTQNDVAFASMSARSLDPKFLGAIAAAPEGQVVGPVAGSIGTYVFKVTGRETGSFYTESDAKNANAQILNYDIQNILPVMMLDANVKDNRARFF